MASGKTLPKVRPQWAINRGMIHYREYGKEEHQDFMSVDPPFKVVPLFFLPEWIAKAKGRDPSLDISVDQLRRLLEIAPVPVFNDTSADGALQRRVADHCWTPAGRLLESLPDKRPPPTTVDIDHEKRARTPTKTIERGTLYAWTRDLELGYLQTSNGEIHTVVGKLLAQDQIDNLRLGGEYTYSINEYRSVVSIVDAYDPA